MPSVRVREVRICNPRSPVKDYVNTTSRASDWARGLSPFFLGPVKLYNGYISRNMENAWQYAKVYPAYADSNGDPTPDYFIWARRGWGRGYADRYPMGKDCKPLYSFWDGNKLGYVSARKQIYCPLYAGSVEATEAYRRLKKEYRSRECIWLWDFDGYDHVQLGMSYHDVLHCETRKMGHAFVLAMMLQDQRIWEDL